MLIQTLRESDTKSSFHSFSKRLQGLMPISRNRQSLWLGIIIAAFGLALAPATAFSQSGSPNIVLIIGDDHGWPHSGFMGDPVAQTPNLDTLAAEGTVFNNAQNSAALCIPSLRTLLSGVQSAKWDDVRAALVASGGTIDPPRSEVVHMRTLPRELQREGYVSWEGGKMWFGNYEMSGFTHGMAEDPYVSFWTNEGARFGREGVEPWSEFLDGVGNQPFFAWVAPMLPHCPFDSGWNAPENYRAIYEQMGLSGTEAAYYGNVTWLDQVVGDVIAELESRGMRENTLIIYVSDNGHASDLACGATLADGKAKGTLYDLGMRTPLIFNWPGQVAAGVTRDDLVSTEEIFPTVLDYAGATSPLPDREGLSLKPAIETGSPVGREKLVSLNPYSLAFGTPFQDGYFVRTANWRYIDFGDGTVELYRIDQDPHETNDVAASHPAEVAAFAADVEAWKEARSVAPERLEVAGQLQDQGGQPVANLALELRQGESVIEATTDSRGFFVFPDIAHGEYELAATGDAAGLLDWLGNGPSVPVQVPTGALGPYLALETDTYQNPIGGNAHIDSPTVMTVDGVHYLFSSSTGHVDRAGNVPVQRAMSPTSFEYLGDALPNLPGWVDPLDPSVSGPTAFARESLGRYFLYFSARHMDDGSPDAGKMCIGLAASESPDILLDGGESIVDNSHPVFCLEDGDALDPNVFMHGSTGDGDPLPWLLWVERRSGAPDVIKHQLMELDGSNVNVAVPDLPLLTADDGGTSWDQGLLSNPALVLDEPSGRFVLFYSASNKETARGKYGTHFAHCPPTYYGVFNPCERAGQGPWFRRADDEVGPGNADFFRDADGHLWMVYDASHVIAAFGVLIYQKPTLRVDKVCFDPEGRARTAGPTMGSQPMERFSDCSEDVVLQAEAWPEADQLFRQDPRWRGGDGAWSVDLGDGRTLWTFGDSFIDPEGESRVGSRFIRNSIAIQHGDDPTTAEMKFYWGEANGEPSAFFPNKGSIWYWGGMGAVINDRLVLFFSGNDADENNDWFLQPPRAVVIENYQDTPDQWVQEWFDLPEDPEGNLWGPHYAFVERNYLYLYTIHQGSRKPGLVRFGKGKARRGNFKAPRWWDGTRYRKKSPPAALWQGFASQYSVFEQSEEEYLAIMGGIWFGPGLIATAPEKTGPFTPFQTFFDPPERTWGGADKTMLTYLWRVHKQLTGADVVVTYSTNNADVFIDDESPYYPKFIKVKHP